MYSGRAPHTKGTLPDFREKCRVARHSRVFHGLTGSKRTQSNWGARGVRRRHGRAGAGWHWACRRGAGVRGARGSGALGLQSASGRGATGARGPHGRGAAGERRGSSRRAAGARGARSGRTSWPWVVHLVHSACFWRCLTQYYS